MAGRGFWFGGQDADGRHHDQSDHEQQPETRARPAAHPAQTQTPLEHGEHHEPYSGQRAEGAPRPALLGGHEDTGERQEHTGEHGDPSPSEPAVELRPAGLGPAAEPPDVTPGQKAGRTGGEGGDQQDRGEKQVPA